MTYTMDVEKAANTVTVEATEHEPEVEVVDEPDVDAEHELDDESVDESLYETDVESDTECVDDADVEPDRKEDDLVRWRNVCLALAVSPREHKALEILLGCEHCPCVMTSRKLHIAIAQELSAGDFQRVLQLVYRNAI